MDEQSEAAQLIKSKIDRLVRSVKYYDYMLHVKGETLIDDEIYDFMRRELETLESQFPEFVREDSPSFYIGCVDQLCEKTVKRSRPMLSLKHTYNRPEVEKFVREALRLNESLILEPKIDGVAVSIIYIDGFFDSMSLRGNGMTGEDVSHLAPYIENLPLKIETLSLEIRGEVIAPKTLIQNNNRNYVAGCLRRKEAGFFGLKFFPYTVCGLPIWTQAECLQFLSTHMQTTPYKNLSTDENVFNIISDFYNQDFEFFADGVVIKMNDIKKGEALGTSSRYPRSALAYKFSEKYKHAEVVEIKWTINRKGGLVPLCLLTPIQIGGSNIKQVHGFNKRYLWNNSVGVGTKLSIARVGDVIPQIASILQSSKFEPLDKCPFCYAALSETDINYVCTNSDCDERSFQQTRYFFSKLKIDGLSFSILKRLQAQNVRTIPQIIDKINDKNFSTDKNDSKVRQKWIARRKEITLKETLIALGIPNISDVFIGELDINSPEELKKLPTMEGKKFASLKDFIENKYHFLTEIWGLIKNQEYY